MSSTTEIKWASITTHSNSDRSRSWRTRLSLRASGSTDQISERVKANRPGPTVPCTRDGGEKTKPMVKDASSTLMAMSTMECGSMIRPTATESTAIWTVPNMKEIGKRINSMGRVSRRGLMAQNMMVNTFMVRSMERAASPGLTAVLTTATSRTITFKVTDHIIGLMVECSSAPGSITKWKAKALSRGRTAENMKGST